MVITAANIPISHSPISFSLN